MTEQAGSDDPDRRQRELSADFSWVLEDARGRRALWWVLSEARVFHGALSLDHAGLAFVEGRRALGLAVLDQIHRAKPAAFATMIKETPDG